MPDLTPELLVELRRLEKRAMPGPWRSSWDDGEINDETPLIYTAEGGAEVITSTWYDGPRGACTEQDAALIAALRNAAPALLDAAEERDRLRGLLDLAGDLDGRLADENASLRDRLRLAEAALEEIEELAREALLGTRLAGVDDIIGEWRQNRGDEFSDDEADHG